MRSTQLTPAGNRVCGVKPLTDAELAAVDALADLVRDTEERRRAALSPAARDTEDARRAEGRARLARLQERARQ